MITPFPRTSTPSRRPEDEEEYDEEPIQTPEEVYEETETDEPERVEVASPTGDNMQLNATPEEQIQPQKDYDYYSFGEDSGGEYSAERLTPDQREALKSYSEPETAADEPYQWEEWLQHPHVTGTADTIGGISKKHAFEMGWTPDDWESHDAEFKIKEREWFNFRLETADTPNVIAGINKASAFKNGWSPERWRQFVNKYQVEKQRKQRISSNSRARNGFEIGYRPPQRQAAPARASRYNLGDNVSGGIERGYDLLGLNGGMAGYMSYDQYSQQSLSNSVFGNLPTRRGGNNYDPIGIGFAGGGDGGEIIFGGIGGDNSRRSPSRTMKAASTNDLVFGSMSAPARRPAAKKSPAKPKKPASKPKAAAGRPTASTKKKPVSATKKSAPKKAPIKKRAVKSTPAKKTHVPVKKSAPVRKSPAKKSTAKKSVGGKRR